MHSPSLESAVRRIRSLAAPMLDAVSDRDLLAQYLAARDESAFAALVDRHGPAVLGVCHRVLADRHAAEDAVQATFLVLARRAAAIRKTASVGCWLHGVAFRVASKLKGRLARQPRPADLPDLPVNPHDDVSWRDVRRVLDEELSRLPDRLRLPVWLCYFEGKTRDEAAETLGWKVSTLRGRLEDGRQRLRARLALRGVELSAALVALSTADATALDPALAASAVRSSAGSASPAIQSLAKGVAMSGAFGKLKMSVGALLLVVGLGSTLLAYRGEAGETPNLSPPPKALNPPPITVESPPPKTAPKADEWGEPAGDFRLRLHKPAGPLRAGDLPELACDLKNGGKQKRSAFSLPENAAIELDGRWYHSHREGSFGGRTHEIEPGSEQISWLRVRPDAQWINLRDNPTADDPAVREAVPFRLSAGRHTLRVAYTLGKDERPVSNPVVIDVAPDGWGEPVAGIRARLRLPKTRYQSGDSLTFELDLRSDRRAALTIDASPYACEVILDGEVYQFRGAIDRKANRKELMQGVEKVPFVTVATDTEWQAARRPAGQIDEIERPLELVPFRLTPGKHTIAVAFSIDDPKARPISDTVQIEVDAPGLDANTLAITLGADRIWVVPSPTRDKPVPTPEHVLKGPPLDRPAVFDLRLLPGDDPRKKWIVFLRADEHGRPLPEVQPRVGSTWHLPYDEGTVAAIRQTLLPVTWGPEKDGLRLGLRLRNATVAAGDSVIAEVVVRNAGNVNRTVKQHRFNIYDYWPGTRFEMTAPDGSHWIAHQPTGIMNEADNPRDVTLRPGETYVHAISPSRLSAYEAPPKGEPNLPNLFVTPGEYSIMCRYAAIPVVGEAGWQAGLSSNTVKLAVTKSEARPPEWGESSGGVRARLRLVKSTFRAGDRLEFDLDLMNTGDKTYEDGPVAQHCEIELDDARYTYTAPLSVATMIHRHTPGTEFKSYVRVLTDDWWIHARAKPGGTAEAVPLALTAGKHTLRVAYPLSFKDKVKPVTQTVEFEVKPEAAGK